jgi:diadenylate cyclase
MFEALWNLFAGRPAGQLVRDVADVAIVAFVVYRALLILRGTRALQMIVGLAIIGGLHLAAKLAGLVTVVNLLSSILSSIVLIVVVVFQNDIRRALIRMGDRAWLPGMGRANQARMVEEVVTAATDLARHRIGALITFEQEATLDEFVVGEGTIIDAHVSRELLVTIFQPESVNKLHDGAVIIRNYRIAAAGVFFPMPEARQLDAAFGTRHRAALGISEETDAITLVVSEERGTISLAHRGELVSNLDGPSVRKRLLDLLGHKAPPPGAADKLVPSEKAAPASKGRPPSDSRRPETPTPAPGSAARPSVLPPSPMRPATGTPLPAPAPLPRSEGPP